MTAQDIEIAVAAHFNYRLNLIVPNVSWGWGLRHEADLIIVRPSGYCEEVEIKVTAADIKRDARKANSHWENNRISRVWFAVPEALQQHPDIPVRAGILGVSGRHVAVVRPAKLIEKMHRRKLSDAERLKLAELGSMRIWDLKRALAEKRSRSPRSEITPGQIQDQKE